MYLPQDPTILIGTTARAQRVHLRNDRGNSDYVEGPFLMTLTAVHAHPEHVWIFEGRAAAGARHTLAAAAATFSDLSGATYSEPDHVFCTLADLA